MDVSMGRLVFFLLIMANYEIHGALIMYARPDGSELEALKKYFETLDEAKKSLTGLIMKWFTDPADPADPSSEMQPKSELGKMGKNSTRIIYHLANLNFKIIIERNQLKHKASQMRRMMKQLEWDFHVSNHVRNEAFSNRG